MRTVILMLFLSGSIRLLAGNGDYAVSRIPAALLHNANAVKRMESMHFEVLNTGEAVLRKKYAITVLNEKGERFASFVEYYDKLHELRNIEGALFDAEGRELKRLKNKQVMDLSGSDDNNLADDNRRKAHQFYYKLYPYTVEYEVDIRYNGTLFFPYWLPREDEYFSVEQSSFSVSAPESYTVRYKAFNYAQEPVTEKGEKGRKILRWETKGLPAIEDEYASPGWHEFNPMVYTGPTDFEMEKYKGQMDTWEAFGRFIYSLKMGRDQLPAHIKEKVKSLTAGISDPVQKVYRLYEYLQQNTRYISIQLGIGGWQPFDANYVATKAYGDCKALSNYMYSLLKEAGIPSHYTLIRAGRGKGNIFAEFPSQQFNHVILCVPMAKDTIWLECTSQTSPPGYLGSFTGDRYALLVTEEGGKLVRTPAYRLKDNLQVRHIKASLAADATLNLQSVTKYTGLQQESYHHLIHDLSKDKVKEVLQEQLDFATYEIGRFHYEETKGALPLVEEQLEINASNYASITGKRLFIVPNIMTRTGRKLAPDSSRLFDIVLGMAYQDIDTVEISIPPGYAPEAMPKDISMDTPFGKFTASTRLQGDKLYYYRNLQHYSGRFPASKYPELVKFYETIYKSDRSKAVLVKNQ